MCCNSSGTIFSLSHQRISRREGMAPFSMVHRFNSLRKDTCNSCNFGNSSAEKTISLPTCKGTLLTLPVRIVSGLTRKVLGEFFVSPNSRDGYRVKGSSESSSQRLSSQIEWPQLLGLGLHLWTEECFYCGIVYFNKSRVRSLFFFSFVLIRTRGIVKNLKTSTPQFPSSLVELWLYGTGFSKQEQLASTQSLPNSKNLRLTWNTYVGKEMIFSADGFPKLQELRMLGLTELERWTIEVGAMPCLRRLSIDAGRRLEMVPDGLQHVTTLQQLNLLGMPAEFKERVRKEEGEDWEKLRHIPSIDVPIY